ncbi:hypothetical protein BIV25_17990 [Streptomyces sp. MUSC 14]|nr:hypothetical protein BIV25_17990 [Streptomyces sp. MUSC 14]
MRGWARGQAVTARVGHLDAERGADDVERESEVPSGHLAVRHGVGGQLRHDVLRGFQRELPVAELLYGEQSGQSGAAWGGGQQHREVGDDGFLDHVTQGGHFCFSG